MITLSNALTHLLDVAWSKRYGRGIIDCHYDSATESVSVCDLSGLTVISDSSGKELVRTVFDMPAWGVAHRLTEKGFIIACALADKVNDRGAVVLRQNSVDIFRIDYKTECWDVYLSDDFLYWTLWDGRCGRIRLSDLESNADYVNLGSSAYGISSHDKKIFVTAQGIGVFQIDDGLSFTPELILSNTNVCYNTIYDKISSNHYTGSSSNSPVIQGIELSTDPTLDGSVCGIATFGDFLFVGTLNGELSVLAPNATSRIIGSIEFKEGIWNISISHDNNRLYVACGDGRLYCFKIMINSNFKANVQEIENAFENITESYNFLSALTSIPTLVLASNILETQWDSLSDGELKTAGNLLQKWTVHLSDARTNYLVGLYFISTGQFNDAVVALQKTKHDKEYFLKSLMPLSKAFERVGTLSSAIKILRNNLEEIPEIQIAPFLFRIGELCEKCGEKKRALDAYEALSYLQHSYPGLQEAIERLTQNYLLSNNKARVTFEQVMQFDKLNRGIYDDICKQYGYRNLVPFVGAGMSALAGFPLWGQFLSEAYKEHSDYLNCDKMPSNILDAASILYDGIGRATFNRYFENAFGGHYSEDAWHRIINQSQDEANGLLPKLFYDAVITTNFDRFLERLYSGGTIIAQPHNFAQLNRAMQDRTTIIVKLHGCVSEPESIIFTKETYDDAYPATGETKFTIALEKFLANRTLLFLGCSLDNDATIKHLIKFINDARGMGIDHYAIVGCNKDEKIKKRRDLSKKGILAITYDCCGDSKHDAVRAILQQLKDDTT